MSEQNINTWDKGFEARMRGKRLTANPYRKGLNNWLRWSDGWKDADEHERDKEYCLDQIGWFG